jgi:phosphohistidine phosphatase
MKTLYLVRHAKSSWKNPGLKDLERPLNARGKNDAPKMGKLLKKLGEQPDLIISSPAKRALRTAAKIAKETGYPVKKIVKDEMLYLAGQDDFFAVISKMKKSVNRMMIVSHNFGLTIFANFLLGSDIINIPTAGIVRIDFDIKKWKEIKDARGKLIFFEYPKKKITDGI